MMKRNRPSRLALPHNDSLPGIRSVMDAIESRGGVFSIFRDPANKSSASVFTTRVDAIENPNGTTGLNTQATMPKAATHRYSCRAAAWNMTTVAAAGIRISKPAWYPPAKRPRNAGSKRPPRSAALAVHFMNFVSIVPLYSTSDPGKGSADLSCANRRCVPSGAPAPLFAAPDPLAQSCNEQDDARDEEQRNRDCQIYICRVQWVHLRPSDSETCAHCMSQPLAQSTALDAAPRAFRLQADSYTASVHSHISGIDGDLRGKTSDGLT
jgi:hypothetical protein